MAVATRNDFFTNMGKGKGWSAPIVQQSPNTSTAATASSGFHTAKILMLQNTTYPSSLISFHRPTSAPSSLFHAFLTGGQSGSTALWLAQFHLAGTVDLTATGDKFTAAAGVTYPLNRTVLGAATQPVTFLPLFFVTTATTTTAAVFRLRTAAGGAGYVNQDGSSVVGTKTITLPSATTAASSGFFFRLEDGDSGVQSISAVEVTTAAAAGAAAIYMVELLTPISGLAGGGEYIDTLFSPLAGLDMAPPTPTSGTLTSYLGILSVGVTGGNGLQGFFQGSLNA